MLISAFHGLATGAGLIIAIGAQNAFVLGQGLRREHPWVVAAICALCDWLLIGLGVLGLGRLIASQEGLMLAARLGGAAFLFWQAWLALRRLLKGDALAAGTGLKGSLRGVVLATLAVTLLNPQVYLDTLIMLGAIGAVQTSPLGFYLGAAVASFGWFFGLVAAAGWLAPRLASPLVWRVVDGLIATLLTAVALGLLAGI
ncbi:L-lysine exporter family protein LysE/ArgO [Modicisalibacter ilicicola DSM 19980]|uniref:L-lysine exporter family protein LysE/ArgO n=1 Tax=Modicisalibacter ilicicola DSM 19980 TaxID=1121942 RepID=A0A1M5BXD4_9GAMM|nr:LysE family transporter [Halomonas ilicicola]SHF47030.1 L-lysine exporter family protein LysE/ArgO [Halomonas ilicicola DSM 19980]